MDKQIFLSKCDKVHANRYSYRYVPMKVRYIDKVSIVCNIHGPYKQSVKKHINGRGCPKCGFFSSVGEDKVESWLKENCLYYEPQKKFEDCKHRSFLRFDFHLPFWNTCIEYQGKFHFHRPYDIHLLEEQKHRDILKKKYCDENGIRLLCIHYKQKEIVESVLDKYFFGNEIDRQEIEKDYLVLCSRSVS